jgi:hypothetical protein
MNDEQANNLLSRGLQGPSLNPALQQRFLERSSLALVRTCQHRRRTRRAYYAAILALGLAVGFTVGRVHERQAASATATNTALAHKDMVAWLHAGRLFTQINLEERAGFAYAQASQLARSVRAEQQVAQSRPGAPSSQATRKLADLLAQYESQKPRPGSTEKLNINSLLATTMGERK